MASPEQKNTLRVQELYTTYWSLFENWRTQNNTKQTLQIPEGIDHVLIPLKLLELADNPEDVHIKQRVDNKSISFLIFERLPRQISNPEKFNEWVISQQGKPRVTEDPYNNTDAPEEIDYMHIKYADDVVSGTLTLNDKVLLWYGISTTQGYPHIAETVNLFDRLELRGKGIGSSFYSRLEDVLRSLEFEFLAGQIWSPNPGFFSKTRKPYEAFNEPDRKRLPPHFASIAPEGYRTNWMIKKL